MKHTDKIAKVATRIILTSTGGVTLDVNNNPQLRCPHCLQWKPLHNFGFRYMEKDDTIRNQARCIPCRSVYGDGEND